MKSFDESWAISADSQLTAMDMNVEDGSITNTCTSSDWQVLEVSDAPDRAKSAFSRRLARVGLVRSASDEEGWQWRRGRLKRDI